MRDKKSEKSIRGKLTKATGKIRIGPCWKSTEPSTHYLYAEKQEVTCARFVYRKKSQQWWCGRQLAKIRLGYL